LEQFEGYSSTIGRRSASSAINASRERQGIT